MEAFFLAAIGTGLTTAKLTEVNTAELLFLWAENLTYFSEVKERESVG